MKRILGLDLGTNSIGWALIENDFIKKKGQINGLGSRIIPMGQNEISDFGKGITASATAERTNHRGTRRLYQRDNLRRERLHRVLNILGYLPEHYSNSIDFETRFGQFKKGMEPKLAYKKGDNGKHQFIFQEAFSEMVDEFKANGQDINIPHDWTIYYLRKKALTKKISPQELAWIILNFNQKRGYYQARGEDEEFDKNKNKEFITLTGSDAIDTGNEVKGKKLYELVFNNGWKYDKPITKKEKWIGKVHEFIVTTSALKDGEIKRSYKQVNSEEDWIAIKEKSQQDIVKFNKSNKTIGTGSFIYHKLLDSPTQKIRGKLIKTIERHFYKDELEKILETQMSFHDNLRDAQLYKNCLDELYKHNEAHKFNIAAKDFKHLFVNDIIFYHRPLKTKKSTIANCPYEKRYYVLEGKRIEQSIKCISKSHPLYQEFRIWQFIHNLRIYKREHIENNILRLDVDVSSNFLNDISEYESLYRFLDNRKDINQKILLKYFKVDENNYRWNYVEDIKYPCNELKYSIKNALSKVENVDIEKLLSDNSINKLWHIIYSVKDRIQYGSALETFAEDNGIDVKSFRKSFIKFPPFESDYGAYSEKALKKILSLMRQGTFWNEDDIETETKQRIDAIIERLDIIDGDVEKIETITDDDIPKQVLKSFAKIRHPYQGLNTYQACYAIYNRHSEVSSIMRWRNPQAISDFLDPKIEGGFKQHSLRNPIVEKIVTETLRVVRDIWFHYGNGKEDYFTEIHVELGRDMKNSKKSREIISDSIKINTDTNERIKSILKALMSDDSMEGEVRPYSKGHQDILKLYEQGVYSLSKETYNGIEKDEIDKIRKKSSPTKTEINKYKLWLQQGYVSPYTGKMIPLSKLFTSAYEIEHIIPRSRYFDDSLSNKVICESAINPNPYKGNLTAYEFIKRDGGRLVSELSDTTGTVKILSLSAYESHCKQYFKGKKLEFLLSEEIPEMFINRQLNDSRYISKVVKSLLSNVVREVNENEATSKNLVPLAGRVTSELKNHWGLFQVWDELLTPRFERMNEITDSTDFRFKTTDAFGNENFINTVPDEIAKDFSKKRLDHRHHALDALIIALATKDHINYLNNQNATKKEERYDLKKKLSFKTNKDANGNSQWQFYKPWETLTQDSRTALEQIVVSFKKDKRVINKATNYYTKWIKKDGKWKKDDNVEQITNNWAIRKSMHDPMPYGEIKMQFDVLDFHTSVGKRHDIFDEHIRDQIDEAYGANNNHIGATQKFLKSNSPTNKYGFPVSKGRFKIDCSKYGKRQPINKLTATSLSKVITLIEKSGNDFEQTKKLIAKAIDEVQKSIWKVGDLQLQIDLETFLYNNIKDNTEQALFSSDGIETFNSARKNNGKYPVYNLRFVEDGEKRFPLGDSFDTKHKMMEATDGNNMFFNIYWDEEKQKRNFETVPLIDVIKHQKEVAALSKEKRTEVPINDKLGEFLFSLSPNEVVYVPTIDDSKNPEKINLKSLYPEQINRLYKMVSCTKKECHFVPLSNANEIQKNENGTNSKNERIQFFTNERLDENDKPVMIKKICWKLTSDRLGNLQFYTI